MRTIHITAECYPVAKVGGLADVLGALPKYLNELNTSNAVVMPYYENTFIANHTWEVCHESYFRMDTITQYFKILKETDNSLGFELYLVWIEGILDREKVYGYHDDNYRFLTFQIAILEWMNSWKEIPNIVHCHDHQTGLIPFFMKYSPTYQRFNNTPTAFTIHNAAYQGIFPHDFERFLPSIYNQHKAILYWNGVINSLATAIKTAWVVTTVSPNYMHELAQSAQGLESLINHEFAKCKGVLNGIDSEVWNPKTDEFIKHNFNLRNYIKGKKQNKQYICATYGLDEERALVVFIGRFAYEKGADVLAGTIYDALAYHNQEVNFLVLGSGDQEIENQIESLKHQFPGRVNNYIGYNEAVSHEMYAAADFIIMPSRVEPCGLTQLYAMRYGAIPIVRSTGGLYDTVIDYDAPGGYGVIFYHVSKEDINFALTRALYTYHHPNKFKEMRKTCMGLDFSWEKSAETYINIYQNLTTNI